MKTLIFKPHPACPDSGIQAIVQVNDEIELSIIQGPAFYCTSTSYEVGITFIHVIDGSRQTKVAGWKSIEQVEALIESLSDFS